MCGPPKQQQLYFQQQQNKNHQPMQHDAASYSSAVAVNGFSHEPEYVGGNGVCAGLSHNMQADGMEDDGHLLLDDSEVPSWLRSR
jgi:hypothetical protein